MARLATSVARLPSTRAVPRQMTRTTTSVTSRPTSTTTRRNTLGAITSHMGTPTGVASGVASTIPRVRAFPGEMGTTAIVALSSSRATVVAPPTVGTGAGAGLMTGFPTRKALVVSTRSS